MAISVTIIVRKDDGCGTRTKLAKQTVIFSVPYVPMRAPIMIKLIKNWNIQSIRQSVRVKYDYN